MDLQLKQRLVGATVLVVLAVIVVPELLRPQAESAYSHLGGKVDADNLAPDQGQVRLSQESPDAPVTVTTRNLPRVNTGESVSLSLPPRSESVPVAEVSTTEPVAAEATPKVEVAAVQTPAPTSKPKPTPTSKPVATSKPELPKLELVGRSGSGGETTASSGGWKVQVASLKDKTNATRQRTKLEKAGLPADVKIVDVQGVPLYRVAIGPFVDSTAAKSAQEKAVSLGFRDAFLVSP